MKFSQLMEPLTEDAASLGGSSKRIARSLMAIGESRLELLLLELAEERVLFIRSLIIALGIFAFGLLGMMTLTAVVVIGIRPFSPVLLLGLFTALYGTLAFVLALVLRRSMRQSEPFSSTIDQLRKDHRAVEKIFS